MNDFPWKHPTKVSIHLYYAKVKIIVLDLIKDWKVTIQEIIMTYFMCDGNITFQMSILSNVFCSMGFSGTN